MSKKPEKLIFIPKTDPNGELKDPKILFRMNRAIIDRFSTPQEKVQFIKKHKILLKQFILEEEEAGKKLKEAGLNKLMNWLDLELELWEEVMNQGFEEETHSPTPINLPMPGLKLNGRKGSKTDLIRILNTLYELRFFQLENGQIPTKEEFMISAGAFFGVDLSNYSGDLSQALKNGKLETNLKIFEEMKEALTKAFNDRNFND